MTPDERISAYIDNELTSDQEQEFLISLAASNGLRKAFRSELVLKNVLHRDESVTNPPRGLRTAVFASLGLGAATALTDRADAAQAGSSASSTPAPVHSFVKTLFATKINAFITAATLSISALVGYGVHSLTAPSTEPATSHVARTVTSTQNVAPQVTAAPSVEPSAPVTSVVTEETPVKHSLASKSHKFAPHSQAVNTQPATTSNSEVKGTVGAGSVTMHEPVVVQPNKK